MVNVFGLFISFVHCMVRYVANNKCSLVVITIYDCGCRKLKEKLVHESVVSMFPYIALRSTAICPPALQPPAAKVAKFRTSRAVRSGTPSGQSVMSLGRSVTSADRGSQVVSRQPETGSLTFKSSEKSTPLPESVEHSVASSETREVTPTPTDMMTVTPSHPASALPSPIATIRSAVTTPEMLVESVEVVAPIASVLSEFLGSRRMEGLLQALGNERNSGLYLRNFIKNSDHEVGRCFLEPGWERLFFLLLIIPT